MKTILSLFFIVISYNVLAAFNSDTLKNSSIIKMTNSKLGDNLILSKIKSSPIDFDISTDALIALKKANVTDVVIAYIVEKQTELDELEASNLKNNSSTGNHTFQKSGIYFGTDESKFTKLDPTVFSSTFNGVYFPRYVCSLIGNNANYTLTQSTYIYFNFIPSKKDLNSTNNSGSLSEDYMDALINQSVGSNVAISPNEFKLIKLSVTNKKRSCYWNATISHQIKNLPSKFIIDFRYEKVSEYTYKIILPEKIIPGQYCFIYLSGAQKAFDFEIK